METTPESGSVQRALEEVVPPAETEAVVEALATSLAHCAASSEKLAAGLGRLEVAMGRLRAAAGPGTSCTLSIAGDSVALHVAPPGPSAVLEVTRRLQRGEVTPGMARPILLEAAGMTAEGVDRLLAEVEAAAKRPAPPPELVAQAEVDWASATEGERTLAAGLYECLIRRQGRRSAVSWASLPTLPACAPLVRANWLDVARLTRTLVEAGPATLADEVRLASLLTATPSAQQ